MARYLPQIGRKQLINVNSRDIRGFALFADTSRNRKRLVFDHPLLTLPPRPVIPQACRLWRVVRGSAQFLREENRNRAACPREKQTSCP
jgi:hypothetical protein